MEMRRLTLFGTLGVLLAVLYFLWQYRFERAPNDPTIRLSELHKINSLPAGGEWIGNDVHPLLKLKVDREHSKVVARLDFPKKKAVDFLHLRFQVRARDLQPDKESWQDGRCLIEWQPASGGSEREIDPFCSVRFDQVPEMMEWVMRPNHPPAIPSLRFENLGTSGTLEISTLEATVLRERTIWKIGRWILMAAWIVWIIAWIGFKSETSLIRSLAAATILLIMGLYFVIPGPWKSYRSFGSPFQTGSQTTGMNEIPESDLIRTDAPLASDKPADLGSVGKIPTKGDFTLRLKLYAVNARPLFHVGLLFVPALMIACLVGRTSAWSLAAIFSLAMEAAQFAFGYGFNWLDLSDLIADGVGIFLAMVIHQKLQKRFSTMIAT
jgi:hypothetical protein